MSNEVLTGYRDRYPNLRAKYEKLVRSSVTLPLNDYIPEKNNVLRRSKARITTLHKYIIKLNKTVEVLTPEEMDELEQNFYLRLLSKSGIPKYQVDVYQKLNKLDRALKSGAVTI